MPKKKGIPKSKRGTQRKDRSDRQRSEILIKAAIMERSQARRNTFFRRNTRKLYVALAALVVIIAVGIVLITIDDQGKELQFITVEELRGRMDSGESIFFLDNRTDSEWSSGTERMPSAIHILESNVEDSLDMIPMDRTVVTYCT